jgi:orotate phosphoribosyltransferase
LAEAKAQQVFDTNTLNEVEQFLQAPRDWQDAHK